MKKKETFEKNIEKLMKLSIENDQPSQAFVEKLIDDAMDQLKTPQENIKLSTRRNTMKLTFKHTAAMAAGLIVVAGIFAVVMTELAKQRNAGPAVGIRGIAKVDESQADELVALSIALPGPVAGGTERTPKVENLQPVPESARPTFYVPAGTTNIALGKPVSGSDENPIGGTLAKITDGDNQGTDGSFIEMGLFGQHVTIDLGAKHNIYAIVAWHYFAQNRVYFDVVVQAADDPDFTANVITLFNNDTDNSLGLGIGNDKHYIETLYGKLIDAKGVQARYVRLYSNGNDVNELNHYIEVQVFGKPIE